MDFHSFPGKTERPVRIVVIALSLLLPLLFFMTAAQRVRYPYELEELEGNMVRTVERVLHHQPVYIAPNVHFVPFMYTPGYSYAAAAMAHITGIGFLPLRLVSIISTAGIFLMLAALIWRETRSWMAAAAAAALYAGCYPLCQNWYDLARLDSLFVFLMLIAMYCTRWLHPVVAALAWVAVFQTKQSILPAAVVLLCCRIAQRRQTIAALAVFAAGVSGSVLWLNHATNGWYSFYVFKVPSANSDLILRPLVLFLPEFFHTVGIAVVLIVVAVLSHKLNVHSLAVRFYLATGVLVLLAWFIMMHTGSTGNVYMPACAVIALLFALAAHRLLRDGSPTVRTVVLSAMAIQLFSLIYNPGAFRPTAEQKYSAEASIQAAKMLGGHVYLPQHTYYGQMAGAPEMADMVAFQDAQRPLPSGEQVRLRTEMESMLTSGAIQGVFLDSSSQVRSFSERNAVDEEWISHYPVRMPLPGATAQSRPAWFLLPCTLSFSGQLKSETVAPQAPLCTAGK
ncbi:MAG: hypothetical protein JSS87_01015 [Acidobacteria bacterium]|nr:hypothetical protein [Acidobacteriota bacterium]